MSPRPSAVTAALAAGRMVAGLTPSDESPAHFALSARTRLGRIAQLRRYVQRWGARAEPRWRARFDQLLLARGRFARRARRARIHGIGTTVKAIKRGRSVRPTNRYAGVSASSRIARADRVLLLRQEGRPITGRQWRKLRKAARRQERAA